MFLTPTAFYWSSSPALDLMKSFQSPEGKMHPPFFSFHFIFFFSDKTLF